MFPGRPTEVTLLRHSEPMVAQAIITLQRRAYRAEAQLIGFPDLPPLRESPADIISSDETFHGLTGRSGLIALTAIQRSEDVTIISRLCVPPEHARRGHATRLVRHVLETSDHDVLVETAEANEPALRLYGKLGFQRCGKRLSPEGLGLVTLRFYREDATGAVGEPHEE